MISRSAYRVETGALLRLAAPIVFTQLSLTFMGFADTIMVGHVSSAALAAVAIGNIYHWALLVFGQGILFALDPLVSQAYGAGDRQAVSDWFYRGLTVAIILSAIFYVAFQFSAPILIACGQPLEIVPMASAFVRANALGVPAFFIFVALRQTLQSMSITRPLVIAAIIGNIANLILNYLLIFGHGGFPAMGAAGAGLSTSLSRYLMMFVLVIGAREGLRDVLQKAPRLLEWAPYRRLLSIGLPTGIQIGLEVWAFMTVSLIMGTLGTLALGSHQIALQLASLSYMIPLGIGAAAATRVGNAIGRGDPTAARIAATTSLFVGAIIMLSFAFLFAAIPAALSRMFTDDAEVIRVAVVLLPIAALFQIFDATQAVACGILRGLADTRAAAIINLIGYWVLALPIGYALAFRANMGPTGLWWGLTLGLALVSVLLVARVRKMLR